MPLLVAAAIAVTWPLALHLANGVTDFGDPLLNSWILAWDAHALATSPRHLFDANIFYPESWTLAYSETLLLPGAESMSAAIGSRSGSRRDLRVLAGDEIE